MSLLNIAILVIVTIGVLLVINLAVLLGLLFRSEVNPVPATAVKIEKPAPAEADNFAAQVAEAKQNVPARSEPRLPASNTLPAPSTTSAPSDIEVSPAFSSRSITGSILSLKKASPVTQSNVTPSAW